MRHALAIAFAVLVLWGVLARESALPQPPGVLAPAAPQQQSLGGAAPRLERKDFVVTPLARFALTARVLSRSDYRFDAGADIAPTDLALGWGRMSDSAVLDQIDIDQGGRWYRWESSQWPISRNEIENSSANMHIIPATGAVADALDDVREGQLVTLRGYLVEVFRQRDGYRWRSSLSRSDTGNGSCELIWVESLTLGSAP